MEKATVGTSADFIDDIGFKIAVDGSWDIFALTWKDDWVRVEMSREWN
jgi:hypothetical protein